ncbi:MAG: hypothetical protein ACJ749_00370 [Flavisolibacter sp.]
MLVTKTKPVGFDYNIQGLQKFLYDRLKVLWNLNDDTSLEGNGRCYREKVDTGYIPRLFDASSSEYKNVEFIDDVHAAVFFFDVWDSVRQNGTTSVAKVDLIFMVNLSKIKPDLPYRGDEEARHDIEKLCITPRYNFILKEFGTGIKYVFNRFDGLTTKDLEQYRDTHPLHVFKIGFELIYHIQ